VRSIHRRLPLRDSAACRHYRRSPWTHWWWAGHCRCWSAPHRKGGWPWAVSRCRHPGHHSQAGEEWSACASHLDFKVNSKLIYTFYRALLASTYPRTCWADPDPNP